MSPKQPKRSFLRWVDRLTKTPFFSSRKFQKLKCGEGCPGLMVETNDGREDPARVAWIEKVDAMSSKKALLAACRARKMDVYSQELDKRGKRKEKDSADLRDDLYNVDPRDR